MSLYRRPYCINSPPYRVVQHPRTGQWPMKSGRCSEYNGYRKTTDQLTTEQSCSFAQPLVVVRKSP
ncbi:hypothetical protein J6590_011781 [Homalodisca vitripennis]|nr:hypothetical protein J6590_011781 [Homalodisca vitripennis]